VRSVEPGEYAGVGEPPSAFVDSASFWIAGYFTETQLRHMAVAEPAVIT
jgi:multidrug resistance efflux pump